MGVHGLTGFLKELGVDHTNDSSSILSHNSSTLAIDGNGLVFHLYRMSYYKHHKNVLSSTEKRDKALQAQLLLPTFLPLSVVHETTTNYLVGLTTKHGVHLRIYFDGPNQYMKRQVKDSRAEQRRDMWENVRQLCMHGILPCDGPSKYKSSARKQEKEYGEQMNGNGENAEAEMYLSNFPLSPLVMDQIERSIYAFENMNSVLHCGSFQIIECEGEADTDVAKASADDLSGKTFALACDSDYVIYGYSSDKIAAGLVDETKYLQFQQVDPLADELCVGNGLSRNEVALSLGLPFSSAMVELSILLGNDYTVSFFKHPDQSKDYRESIQWCKEGEQDCGDGERLPIDLSWHNIHSIIDHIAEMTGKGLRLTSDIEDLRLAIDFSYALYSFGDISDFPSTTSEYLEEFDGNVDAPIFPDLPPGFDLSLARDASYRTDLVDACLAPVISYKSNLGSEDELYYIEPRHIDAFRMTMEFMAESERHIEHPRHRLHWKDIQALYVLERCVLAAINNNDDVGATPHRLFNQLTYHSCLEALSFDDSPFDNELVSKNDKAFIDEATSSRVNERDSSVLPIDEHKENILNTIKTQRVTIILGETGSGKSSRLPCFLLRADHPQPTQAAPEVKMICSQPRRIAAKALAERLRNSEPELKDKIALRMGHGMKEYETSNTRCWFVTTGYVVRLLANHPGWFDSHSHLIIDEVHERSVDTDILCLLCRRLLKTHPSIRLVLMSATMAAELYSQYFGTPQLPIHVGTRRFPINEYFVEDLSSLLSLQSKERQIAQQIFDECEKNRCKTAPSGGSMEKLYKMSAYITASVSRKNSGSAILIFVPGMSDIEFISELIENLKLPMITFKCLPIHGDVPFEEQLAVFDPPHHGEVKVIIATNAAESSLTLPDVDHVICLGLCKQMTYNPASHRQMLVPTWISKASATQRAGRTGRVRKGNVYRLYSRNTYHQYMSSFDKGEMLRIPLLIFALQSLREMLGEAVTPILLECLEPPDMKNIHRSFKSLFQSNFINDPSDDGEITPLGSLVVALGIDLTIGSFVGLGIQFGVAPEAIQIAAILSFPKTPWAITSPLYHDSDTFNDITSKTFISKCFFDAGLLSEPFAIANLLFDYALCKDKSKFAKKHRISDARIRQLFGTVQSLRQRVADILEIRACVLEVEHPPRSMHLSKLNILRILQCWVFHDSMIVHDTSKRKFNCPSGQISIDLYGPPVDRAHLLQVLDAGSHKFELASTHKISQSIRFDAMLLGDSDDYFGGFDNRLISYALQNSIGLTCYAFGNQMKIIVPSSVWDSHECEQLRDALSSNASASETELIFQGHTGRGNMRGVRGRACGSWTPCDIAVAGNEANDQRRVFIVSYQQTKTNAKSVMDKQIHGIRNVSQTLVLYIAKTKKKVNVSVEVSGCCKQISDLDLKDLFAAPDITAKVTNSSSRQNVVFFPNEKESNVEIVNSRQLLDDVSEGARLMTVLAAGRRKDYFIRFFNESDSSDFIDINLQKTLSIQGGKWKSKDSKSMVFVPENSAPMATIPVSEGFELYGCCANTLELSGGARRVEGITLMPPGRLFIGLSLLAFGFHPRTGLPLVDRDDESNLEQQDILNWVMNGEYKPFKENECSEEWRVIDALKFNAACMNLGEELECQPDMIKELCALFDGVCGPMVVWDIVTLSAANAAFRPKQVQRSATDQACKQSDQTVKLQSFCSTIVDAEISTTDQRENVPSDGSPKMKFICDGCNETFSKANQRIKHMDKCILVNFVCVKCKILCPTWASCLKHRNHCCPGEKSSRKEAVTVVSAPLAEISTADQSEDVPVDGSTRSPPLYVA